MGRESGHWLEGQGGDYLLQLLITVLRVSFWVGNESEARETSPGGAPSTNDETAAMAADDILGFVLAYSKLL